MKKYLTAFFMSWNMFLAMPCPRRDWDESLRPLMMVFLPLIGVFVGGLWAFVCWGLSVIHWGLFGAVLLTACPWISSGMIHLGGFANCCEALFARRAAGIQEGKDAGIGMVSVFAVMLMALAYCAVFSQIPLEKCALSLLFLPPISRAVSMLAAEKLPQKAAAYGRSFVPGKKRGYLAALWAQLALCLALSLLLNGLAGFSAFVAAAMTAVFAKCGAERLGGMSADIANFALTAGEFCGAVSLLLV